jgi:hypothetical protein
MEEQQWTGKKVREFDSLVYIRENSALTIRVFP